MSSDTFSDLKIDKMTYEELKKLIVELANFQGKLLLKLQLMKNSTVDSCDHEVA